MENQQQPQAPAMAVRPWFRLASIRSTEIPVAPAAPPPVAPAVPPPVAAPTPPQPAAPPAAERPLFRLGSLLRTPGAAVPPPPQEPIGQAPPQVQTRVPTPPPTAPTKAPPPPSPRTPLAAAATQQDQQPPSPGQRSPVLAPSPGVRAPSPPATPPPPTSPTVIRPSEPILAPSAAVVRQQPQPTPPTLPPPRTTIVSPPLPPPVTILSPPPAPAPSPRLPSPPLHPEPETKPVVTVVTAQPSRTTQEPTIGLHKDKSNNINGNGGKKKLEMTQLGRQPRGVSPPLPSPTGTPKKPDPAAAAVPGKKKSGSTDEVESRMRVLTLAGENMGAYMNWGSGVPRSGMKGQGRHLTQTPTSQSVEKVAVAVAPGSNGGDASTDQHSHSSIKDVKQGPTGASTWKAGAASAKPMAALVNSNVQSVNNSIMFNSSCEQQSPGVHITLSSGSRRRSSHRLSAGDSNGSTGGDANH